MDLLARVGPLLNHLGLTRADEQKTTGRLSTGLRINDASDDPSALAISETMTARINGLQRGQENAQDAHNLLTVAEGGMSTIHSLLQRMRGLIVQAASDINSTTDLNALQSEIDDLKQEINKIAGSITFNGVHLLDGSLDNSQGSNARVQEIPANPNVFGDVPPKTVANADGAGNPGPLIQNATVGNGVEQATVEFQVIGYDQNAVDPISGPIGGPGLYVQVTAYSTDPSFGNGPEIKAVTAVPENAGPLPAVLPTPSGSSSFFQFTIANLTKNDVGAAQAFTTYKNTTPAGGQALAVNDRGTEGTQTNITIPTMTMGALGVAGVTVAQPVMVDPFNTPVGSDSNTIAAKDAMTRVDNAIDEVSNTRAQVGAQSVALEESTNDTGIQAVATQASESAIRDADIGKETTRMARDQILDQIATSAIVSVQAGEKAMAGTISQIIANGPK